MWRAQGSQVWQDGLGACGLAVTPEQPRGGTGVWLARCSEPEMSSHLLVLSFRFPILELA